MKARFLHFFTGAILALAIYLLSVGPVYGFYWSAGNRVPKAWRVVYAPLFFVFAKTPDSCRDHLTGYLYVCKAAYQRGD